MHKRTQIAVDSLRALQREIHQLMNEAAQSCAMESHETFAHVSRLIDCHVGGLLESHDLSHLTSTEEETGPSEDLPPRRRFRKNERDPAAEHPPGTQPWRLWRGR